MNSNALLPESREDGSKAGGQISRKIYKSHGGGAGVGGHYIERGDVEIRQRQPSTQPERNGIFLDQELRGP